MPRIRRFGGETAKDAKKRHRRTQGRRGAYKNDAQREQGANQTLTSLGTMLADLDGPIRLQDFEGRCRKERIMRLESTEVRVEQELGPLLEAYDKASQLYREFRDRWGIDREPDERYRPEHQTRAHWLIAICSSLELGFAAYTFGRHEANLLSGFAPAMLPAAIVLFLAFLTIRSGRWVVSCSWQARIAGGLVATLATGMAVVALFGAAHYRDTYADAAVAHDTDTTAPESFVAQALETPFSLSSTSWWLFAFSIGAFVFTCYHFWNGDDPHPGLGSKARLLDEATENVSLCMSSLQNEIKAIMDTCLNDANRVVLDQRTQLREALDLVEDELRHQEPVALSQDGAGADGSAAVQELLWRRKELTQWLQANRDLGDMKVRLSLPPDCDEAHISEPRRIDSLVQAVSVEEAWFWLDAAVEKFGFRMQEERGSRDDAAR